MPSRKKKTNVSRGRLKIGDDWNAITIIALSQGNPLKAVAEFVENSIDARASNVQIVRGREQGRHYLRLTDDGEGIPRDPDGLPDFKYVATHICDSIKRHLKDDGAQGLQGEFGIGLLSFWTIGEALTLTSAGADGRTYRMEMRKGKPGYTVTEKRVLVPREGTELVVKPILPGLRRLSGEKIQWYLAAELRDRIRQTGVNIKVIDRQARKEFLVEPRAFTGRLLHQLPGVQHALGEVYLELYLGEHQPEHHVGLYRSGTRVLENIAELDAFADGPWASGYLQGIVDAPFLHLTPGTRSGVIRDAAYAGFCEALRSVREELDRVIDAQRRAEEERASRRVLHTIRKAFKEALLALPVEEYDWFDIHKRGKGFRPSPSGGADEVKDREEPVVDGTAAAQSAKPIQKQFFEFAGPLYSVLVSPSSSVVPVRGVRNLRAVARDRQRKPVEDDLVFRWEIVEGGGRLENTDGEIAVFTAPSEPGLTLVRVVVRQHEAECTAEALLTVTEDLLPERKDTMEGRQGLPGYTYRRAPGELWRSRYDASRNVIVINNGHRDFVYASKNKALKLRYICRLFAKELVFKNFPGSPPGELLERMIELTLRTEEHLR